MSNPSRLSIQTETPVNRKHPLNRGLVGWWLRLPGYTGRRWIDLVSTKHGTLTGNPKWSTLRPGGFGSLIFDGVDDYVDIAHESAFDFNQQTFTVAFWRKTSTGGNFAVTKGIGSGITSGWGVTDQGGGSFKAGATTTYSFTPTASIADGRWHHVVVLLTFDTVTAGNNLIQTYVDGTGPVAGTTGGAGGAPSLNNLTVKFGARDDNGTMQTFFVGQLDDVRIYNRGLSAIQIKPLYQLSRLGYPGVLNRVAGRVGPMTTAYPQLEGATGRGMHRGLFLGMR